MPPHCDSVDGPVVGAARDALVAENVDLVLPFVLEESEAEGRAAFAHVLPMRGLSREAGEVADQLFFETVVRLHRAGCPAQRAQVPPRTPHRLGIPAGPVPDRSRADPGSTCPLPPLS